MQLFPGGEGQWGWHKLPLVSKKKEWHNENPVALCVLILGLNPSYVTSGKISSNPATDFLHRNRKHNKSLAYLKTLCNVKYYPYFLCTHVFHVWNTKKY